MSERDHAYEGYAYQAEMDGWFSRALPKAMDRELAWYSQWWGCDLTRKLTNEDRPRRRYGQ